MAPQPPFKAGDSYNTALSPLEEMAFRQWVSSNSVPFNPDAQSSDYDMRGFYRGLQQQSPMAQSGVNANDNKLHYSDYYKTPSHQSFSSESQWADQNTPQWVNDSQLASPSGKIVFDETPKTGILNKAKGGAVVPLTKSASKDAFKSNVMAEINAKKPPRQAVAIAYKIQRDAKKRQGMAAGGTPFYVRSEAHGLEHAGMIHSPVAGRTDRIPIGVKSGGYVVPADVISGLGQGNSMAGANGLNKMLKMGPYGSGPASAPKAMTPKMTAMPKPQKMFADGGDVTDASQGQPQPIPIVAAGGEFVIPSEKVAEIGGGSVDHGHAVLDAFVKHVRSKTIKTLKSLPKPRKN